MTYDKSMSVAGQVLLYSRSQYYNRSIETFKDDMRLLTREYFGNWRDDEPVEDDFVYGMLKGIYKDYGKQSKFQDILEAHFFRQASSEEFNITKSAWLNHEMVQIGVYDPLIYDPSYESYLEPFWMLIFTLVMKTRLFQVYRQTGETVIVDGETEHVYEPVLYDIKRLFDEQPYDFDKAG